VSSSCGRSGPGGAEQQVEVPPAHGSRQNEDGPDRKRDIAERQPLDEASDVVPKSEPEDGDHEAEADETIPIREGGVPREIPRGKQR
jgi:hypothetical protein